MVTVSVYRPPGTVTSTFTDQLSDLFEQLLLLDIQFVVLGDFNVPGVTAGQLDHRVTDVLAVHSLHQHVSIPTRGDPVSGSILDLIVSLDDQPSGHFVSDVAVQSVCFSDHRLVTCCLGVPPTQPVTTTYSYRPLRKIDTVAFGHDILCTTPRSRTPINLPSCLTLKSNAY